MCTTTGSLRSLFLLLLLRASTGVRLGHEVGSTSMDSTHYDRRLLPDQCSLASGAASRESSRSTFWAAARSLASPLNSTNESSLIPLRRQLIVNTDDERLVTKTPFSSVNTTRTKALTIDQATVDIVVDNQVSSTTLSEASTHSSLSSPVDLRQSHDLRASDRMSRLSLRDHRPGSLVEPDDQFNVQHEVHLSHPS